MNIGETVGKYHIRAKLGAGGMGEVYLAHDQQLSRDVALKILSAEFSGDEMGRRRFLREARVASALNHPNILTIYEVGETEEGIFLATELIDGITLRETIRKKSLSIPEALKITEQIASGLSAAHEAKIIHRDIKPENIMIRRRDEYAKVLDFGLAKLIDQNSELKNTEDENNTIKTIPGMVMGSVRYMSPEQARGIDVDGRSDIWSLGVVLYEMIAGRSPFEGATVSDTLAALIYKEPEDLSPNFPSFPSELKTIFAKALAKDMTLRYQTADDFLVDVKKLIYRIEHEFSGEVRTQIISSPILAANENPTMIHHAMSASNLKPIFSASGSITSSDVAVTAQKSAFNIWKLVLLILCAAALLSVSSYGLYRWLGKEKSNLSATVFEKIQISKIGFDPKSQIPAISPDGKYIAYASGEPGNRSLIVRQTTTNSQVTIVPPSVLDLRTIVFTPSGEYIFYTQSSNRSGVYTLYQIPTLGGTPKKLVEDIDSVPTFSPDGKRFAFIRRVSQNGEDLVFTANMDGSNLQQLLNSKQTGFDFITVGALAWSPDGTKLICAPGNSQGGATTETMLGEISIGDGKFTVFSSRTWGTIGTIVWLKDGSGFLMVAEQPQQSFQVWKVAYPSGEISAVTNDLSNYSGLGIADDGSKLITMKSSSLSSIINYSLATKETTQILPESPNLEGVGGFFKTPDGKLIFSRNDAKETNFWITDANGKNERPLTSGAGKNFNPYLTYDGRYIIFNSSRSGNWRIWRMNADGSNQVQLTDSDASNADVNHALTPDGTEIIFSRQFVTNKQPSILMKVPVEGGTATVISPGDTQHFYLSPRVSPDGRHLAFLDYNFVPYEKNIVVAQFDGNKIGKTERTFEYGLINSFDWMPDGKSLIYLSNEGIPNFWKLPLDGTKPQLITDFKSGLIFSWRWAPDGKSLNIVRAVINSDLVLIEDVAKSKS